MFEKFGTYGPASVGNLLLAKDLEEPVRRAPNLEVVDAAVPHPCVQQVHARVSLRKKMKTHVC